MKAFSPRPEARHAHRHPPSRKSGAASGFVDLRPEATAQRELQAVMNRSPQVQRLARLQTEVSDRTAPSGAVIQRYLDIQGAGVFFEGDLEKLREKYSEDAIKQMLREIQIDGGKTRFPDIETVLNSPDLVMIGFANGNYYVEFIERARKVVQGGMERYVGGLVSYAPRPVQGFEDLHLTGLNNCVAIVVETQDDLGVSGIAMAHFTTPSDIDHQSRTFTDHGIMVLNGFRVRMPGGGVARLRWSRNSATDSDKYVSGESAARLVAQGLEVLDITTVSIESIVGGNCRYRLNHDGTAGWV
jgi:hypothetical protein